MIKFLGNAFAKLAERYLPDAFIFAAALTIIAYFLGIIVEHQTPLQMADYWGQGFWELLAFSMQMVLILVSGHALAKTTLVSNFLKKIASLSKTPATAVMLITFITSIACWLNWGFGLVVGGLLAREMVKQIRGIHYSLLVASAYTGFLVWHAGLSGSIPLIIATPQTGILAKLTAGHVIPLTQTIFSYQNFIPVIILIATLPFLNRAMLPKKAVEINPDLLKEESIAEITSTSQPKTFAKRLEDSILISMLLAILSLIYIVHYFVLGQSLDINMVNMIFITLGLILHKRPSNYLHALQDAIKTTPGIVLQFPFYAGIMGMMTHSGLAAAISHAFITFSSAKTFPLYTFFSSGIVNLFIPSGGGHWAVQGPVIMPAAMALGVPLSKAAMAIAWGEAWVNMIQPFWALPILAIAGLGIRDIMGYCTVALLWGGIVIGCSIYFL